ncbi:Glycoside Hydrolase Family 63 protein [Glomus cerebriforme]|uniref:Mannosyl-oligosaccharide glucosidase n=1 Tax=Glomus cerebriforme TaxID=658196 RepID=A0A397SQF3_9GLOM|nr:Glycoside Hydrolase Family 63 protein [Glomus cerebriforme]
MIQTSLTEDDYLLHQRISVLAASNESLLWGTYRPNLYFGTRPRLPDSLLTGLMWFGIDDMSSFKHIRHSCDQGDGLDEYSFKKHDGRNFAIQTLSDSKNNVKLKTEFLKISEGGHGGEWAVRIIGTPINNTEPSGISFLYYFGLEGEGSIDLVNPLNKMGLDSPVELKGETPDLGKFLIKILDDPNNRIPSNIPPGTPASTDLSKFQYLGHLVPDGDVWRARELLQNYFIRKYEKLSYESEDKTLPPPQYLFSLYNEVKDNSNFFVFQKMLEGPFQFDIIFQSESMPAHLDSESLTTGLKSRSQEFDQRFEKTFGLKEKGFDGDQIYFAQTIMSNLIGGIGYFYGSSIVDRSFTDSDEDEEEFWTKYRQADPKLTRPLALFTATPSRPFFPRGFYWDEGFHQLLIGKWDNDLSLDIIKHWISLIDNDGWVAREQILGEEARSKVPEEFQIQYPHYANPPTLLMAIKAFILRIDNVESNPLINVDVIGEQTFGDHVLSTTDPTIISSRYILDKGLANNFLKEIYPKLKLNYKWFRRTQWGEIKEWGRRAKSKEAYRWRGRTPGHTLTSGLDDYPRPTPPHPAELHVDLMCWMGFMARSLKDIAERLEEEDDVYDYTKEYKNIVANLNDLHWSEEHNAFCDLSVDEDEESIFVCHKGYISLFPMVLELLPNDSPKLGAILEIIYNPNELWSKYGLRSLSKSDKFFHTGEDYWRGNVWININYLVLSSLYKNYAVVEGPYKEKAKTIYNELRNNIIENTYKEFKRTGYVWEQYSESTGVGLRSHPFTGWTSLVTLIMAEEY